MMMAVKMTAIFLVFIQMPEATSWKKRHTVVSFIWVQQQYGSWFQKVSDVGK